MDNYHEYLRDIIENGVVKDDRTGVGTISQFGKTMRWDLQEGFPLVTTKKVWFKGVVEELLWMLRGETNIRPLVQKDVHIWDEWAYKDGSLGPVYGAGWRRKESIELVEKRNAVAPNVEKKSRLVAGIGTGGDEREKSKTHRSLYTTWSGMLHRCYNEKRGNRYDKYGGRGVFVSDRWHHFPNFVEDVTQFPRWNEKRMFPDEYSLDKDMKGANWYGPDTCVWANAKEQSSNTKRSRVVKATHEDGRTKLVMNMGDFIHSHDLDQGCTYRVIRGERNSHKGWRFEIVEHSGDVIPRLHVEDQISRLIANLTYEKDSRRHLVNAWDPTKIEQQALPPCHYAFQCWVSPDDKLSLMWQQRSVDSFLGLPFNIASYALLTHLLAAATGYEVGELIFNGGDCHIYQNHTDQVEELLSREPRALPTLELTSRSYSTEKEAMVWGSDGEGNQWPMGKRLKPWEYTYDHIGLKGYDPHPKIAAEVAV